MKLGPVQTDSHYRNLDTQNEIVRCDNGLPIRNSLLHKGTHVFLFRLPEFIYLFL